jgi:hypothetical protein
MPRQFRLEGRLVDDAGRGLPDLFLAFVDVDLLDADDLIGMGVTDPQGGFRLTFLATEFQQDYFESEATPDLKLIVSAKVGEALVPVFVRDYSDLAWPADGRVDLRSVTVKGFNPAAPVALEDEEPMPGYDKSVVRLELDDDLVRHCLAEVAPIVEKLTGWSNLLEGVNVAVADGLATFSLQQSFAKQGIDPDSFEAKLSTFIAEFGQASGAGCALYDPHTHTIAINKKVMEQVGLDGLKVMCGHELVHLGQYKYTPGLKAHNKAMLNGMEMDPEKVDLDAVRASFGYMHQLESYAYYIQTDFLQARFYNLATYPYHQSYLDRLLRGMVALITPNAKETQDLKASQYTSGLEGYRTAQVGDIPTRFSMDVTTLYGYSSES